jgi:urease beta subunit
MLRCIVCLSVLTVCSAAVRASDVAANIAVENASFEAPAINPDAFPAWPAIDGWLELDLDAGSQNTGVFANTAAGSADRIGNADGKQLAFLGSQQGNALEQDLAAIYRAGCEYRLTVAVGVSARFPPSDIRRVDTIDLVLYYLDVNQPVDIVRLTIGAKGQSSTQLKDYTVVLATVRPGDAWAGKTIGVSIRATGAAGGFWDLDNARLVESMPATLVVANASFEAPAVDSSAFPALPYAEGWTELDLDVKASSNTGVFPNTPLGSWDSLVNTDGRQLAFLGSQQGNGFQQDLTATYKTGYAYRLTVGVGVSARFPPAATDTVQLVLYYLDGVKTMDIAQQAVAAKGLSATQLGDFSVYLPAVQAGDAWAGKGIGVAIRSAGKAGGFWDLDNVRLAESRL